tara:strand:- start:2803 stop:3747 length:945 start_codon:yes stop_codon:yes gene_type:complete
MKINDISVVTRTERPSVLAKTALVMYFINDGKYQDPESISGVSIFAAAENHNPSSVIGAGGEITGAASSQVLMHFANSATLTTDSAFDASNFAANADGSGIYRISEGKFAAVLMPAGTTPSATFNLSADAPISNRVSSTGDYIDVWTVLRVEGSDLDTYINEFTLRDDRFFGITEPLLLKVDTRLENNHIVLGSKVDLKFTNQFTIENANIDKDVANLFKYSLIENSQLLVYKANDDRNLPSRVDVSGYADTSGVMDITGENTVIFNFDTADLATHAETVAGNLGSLTGVYKARLKFDVLNQTFITDDLAFVIR